MVSTEKANAALGSIGEPIVGILGGMGPMATAVFYEHLITMTSASNDQEHLHVVIELVSTDPRPHVFSTGER